MAKKRTRTRKASAGKSRNSKGVKGTRRGKQKASGKIVRRIVNGTVYKVTAKEKTRRTSAARAVVDKELYSPARKETIHVRRVTHEVPQKSRRTSTHPDDFKKDTKNFFVANEQAMLREYRRLKSQGKAFTLRVTMRGMEKDSKKAAKYETGGKTGGGKKITKQLEGISLGRQLDIDTEEKFLRYMKDTRQFINRKGKEYLLRKGIGKIRLTGFSLEVLKVKKEQNDKPKATKRGQRKGH